MNVNNLTIRKYNKADKDDVLKILYETSSLPIETEADREFLRLMYNDYYTDEEAENCFVAVDCENKAVGYILCAENYVRYEKNFKNKYLKSIKKLGKNYYIMAKGEMLVHKLYKKNYPAHLHIDILPLCQGKGTGSKLVDSLCEHLKEKDIIGLMLSCGMKNTGAIKFYRKNQFSVLLNFFGSYLMGRKIK